MENHDTGTINSSARYCLAKPGDKVRITKTHWPARATRLLLPKW